MTREEIYVSLNEVFRDVFDDDSITVKDETKSTDIDRWDSLMHITLIGAVEDEFDMKFDMKDIVKMKNVGEMVDIIEREI
jgi:acyl carrier protein